MKQYVIIVAGGKGLRMGTKVPKQFLAVNGKAIIFHTLEKFYQALPNAELVLVLPENELENWIKLSEGTPFANIKIAKGGKSRFDSVKSGLSEVPSDVLVAIHDAVRPLVSVKTIQRVFKVAKQQGSAIPVIELKDSIREIKGERSVSVDRSKFRLVQTPQCFKADILKRAYEQEYQSSYTDDASVYEAFGKEIHLVEGNVENIKITTQDDLKTAEVLLPN